VRTYAPIVVTYALLLVAWELAGTVFHVPKYVLPAPSAIVASLAKHPDVLVGNGWVTLQEVLLGFVLGVVVSIPLGIAIVSWRAVDRIVYPFLIAFQAVPKVALAPILVGIVLALVLVGTLNPAVGWLQRHGLRRHVAVYVNGAPVHDRTKLLDPVGPCDEVYVFQALTGG